MAPDGPPDAEKRETLRQFAAVGAVGPLAAAGRVADVEPASDRRATVLEYVEHNPGLHFSQLRDDLDLGTGETQYHLRKLESAGAVVSHPDGDYRRLFPAGVFTMAERQILSALRRGTHGGVLIGATSAPGIAAGDLADALGISTPAVSRAAGDLADADLLVRDGGRYRATDPESVVGLVAQYGESFDDRTVAAALDAVEELR